jgi:hypothetical protein
MEYYAKMDKYLTGRPLLAVWAGIIGPVRFIAIFTLESWLRPDYNQLEMFKSTKKINCQILLTGGILTNNKN